MNFIRAAIYSAVLLLCVSSTASAQSIPCADPSDDYAQGLVVSVSDFIAGSDSLDADWRARVNIPQTPASSVALVTSDSVCTAAANALAAITGATPKPVWVIAVGPTRYIVFNKRINAGRLTASVFDDAFTWLSGFIT